MTNKTKTYYFWLIATKKPLVNKLDQLSPYLYKNKSNLSNEASNIDTPENWLKYKNVIKSKWGTKLRSELEDECLNRGFDKKWLISKNMMILLLEGKIKIKIEAKTEIKAYVPNVTNTTTIDYISECSSDILFKILNCLTKRSVDALRCTNRKINKILYKYSMSLTLEQRRNLEIMLTTFKSSSGKYINFNTGTGTGKTITTLFFLDKLVRTGKKCLIITKKILASVWKDEQEKYNQKSVNKLIPLCILENPPPKLDLNEKIKCTLEQIKNKSIVVMPRSPVWSGIPDNYLSIYKAPWYNENFQGYHPLCIPYNVIVANWDKVDIRAYCGDRWLRLNPNKNERYHSYLAQKQQLLDSILKLNWDLVVYDDVSTGAELKRLFKFNPNIKCLKLEAKQTKKKNVVGNYQHDTEIGKLPQIETNYREYIIKSDYTGINKIVDIIDDIIQNNSKYKTLIVITGISANQSVTNLGKAINLIKRRAPSEVYFLKSSHKMMSEFSKMKSGILVGSLQALSKGHNIFPQRIYLVEYHTNIPGDNSKYQLIGRIRRPGSPYNKCYFNEIRLVKQKSTYYDQAFRGAILKILSEKNNTKQIKAPFSLNTIMPISRNLKLYYVHNSLKDINPELYKSLDVFNKFIKELKHVPYINQVKSAYMCLKLYNTPKGEQLKLIEESEECLFSTIIRTNIKKNEYTLYKKLKTKTKAELRGLGQDVLKWNKNLHRYNSKNSFINIIMMEVLGSRFICKRVEKFLL